MNKKNLIIGIVLIFIALGIGIYYNNFMDDGIGEGTHEQYINTGIDYDEVLIASDLHGEITSYPAVATVYYTRDGWIPAEQYFTFENKKAIPINNVRLAVRFNGQLSSGKIYQLVTKTKYIVSGSEIIIIGQHPNGSDELEIQLTYKPYYVEEFVKRPTPDYVEVNNKHIYYTTIDFEANEKKTFKVVYLPEIPENPIGTWGKWDVIAFLGNPNNPDYSLILDPQFVFGDGNNWLGVFDSTREDNTNNLTLAFNDSSAIPFNSSGLFDGHGMGSEEIVTQWNMSFIMPHNYTALTNETAGTHYLLHLNNTDFDDEGTGIDWESTGFITINTTDCVKGNCITIGGGLNVGVNRTIIDDDSIENQDISFEFWIKSNITECPTAICLIYSYAQDDDTKSLYSIAEHPSIGLSITIRNGAGSVVFSANSFYRELYDLNWHHVYIQVGAGGAGDDAGQDIWVDGIKVFDTGDTQNIFSADHLWHKIGGGVYRGDSTISTLNGNIDEFIIRRGADAYLSRGQIQANYERGIGKVTIQTAYSDDNATWVGHQNFTETVTNVTISQNSKFVKFWVFMETLNTTFTPFLQLLEFNSKKITPTILGNHLRNLRLNSTLDTNFTDEDLHLSFTPISNNTITPIFANISFLVDWDNSSMNNITYFGNGLAFGMHMSDAFDYVSGTNGSEVGGVIAGGVEGFLGRGTEFDGEDDYIDLPTDIATFGTEAFTISIWAFRTHTGIVTEALFGKSSGTNDRLYFANDNDNNMDLIVGIGSGSCKKTFGSFTEGQWNHFVGVGDGTSIKLYKEGVFITEGACVYNLDSDTTTRIGSIGGGNFFNGTIDEVNIWNKVLSPDEVLDLYNSQVSWRNENVELTNNTYFQLDLDSANTTKRDTWRSEIFWSDLEGAHNATSQDVTILNKPPTIPNIILPDNNTATLNLTINLSCAGSVDADNDPINIEFLADLEINPPTTLRQNSTSTTNNYDINSGGNHWWRCRANDNSSVSSYINTRLITVDRRFITSNTTTANTTAFETSRQIFILNLTKNDLLTSTIDATFRYNNTERTVTKTTEGSDGIVFTSDILIDLISADLQTHDYDWNLTITQLNGTLINNNSFVGAQTVNNITFALCDSVFLNTTFINFTFKDESNDTKIIGTINSATFNYFLSDSSVQRTLLFSNSTVNQEYRFCVSPPSITINMDIPGLFYSSPPLYPTRGFQDLLTLSNTTTEKTLFLLSSITGIFSTMQVVNIANQPLSDVFVLVEKLVGGVFTIIESKFTDAAGAATFFLDPNLPHRFTFTKDGFQTLQTTFTPSQPVFTIVLAQAEVVEESFSRGISYQSYPPYQTLNNNTIYDFGFSIASSFFILDSFGFIVTNISGATLGSNSDTTDIGGNITSPINVGNSPIISMNYFWVINGTTVNLTKSWGVREIRSDNLTLATAFEDIKRFSGGGITNFTKTIIGFFIFLVIIAFASSQGLIEKPLVMGALMTGVTFMLDTAGLFHSIRINENAIGLPIWVIIGALSLSFLYQEMVR